MTTSVRQIPSREQEVVLRTLAETVARRGARLLEVGSWLGESAAILGKVAQSQDGHLFCVDWWQGSGGTDLHEAAQKEDVFSSFWSGICRQGLENTVVPIRGRSDLASSILKEEAFDLVFIDADHRYNGVLRDIQEYSVLVREGGILCGHDCEGRIQDFDRDFLDQGRNTDYFETVHCGVVLAVGETFEDYSVNHAIWSVRRLPQARGWEPTRLIFPGIEDRSELPPPPLCHTRTYTVFRHRKSVYAVPHALLQGLDITRAALRDHPKVRRSKNLARLLEELHESPLTDDTPDLIGNHEGYNLVRYAGKLYAISVELGPLDLRGLDEARLNELQAQHMLVMAENVPQAQHLVDRAHCRRLQDELARKPAQMTALQETVSARDAALGALRHEMEEKDGSLASLRKVIGEKDAEIANNVKQMAALREAVSARSVELGALRRETEEKDRGLASLRKAIGERDAEIAESVKQMAALRDAVSARDAELGVLRREMEEKDGGLASLRKVIGERDAEVANNVAQTAALLSAVSERDTELGTLRREMEEKDGGLASLWKVIGEKDAEIASKDRTLSQTRAALETLQRAYDAPPKRGRILRRLATAQDALIAALRKILPSRLVKFLNLSKAAKA